MNDKYKIGPAKLRDGREAYVFEVLEDRVLGKYKDGEEWIAHTWLDRFDLIAYNFGILPNNEPEKIVIENVGWQFIHKRGEPSHERGYINPIVGEYNINHRLQNIAGKRWKMILEEIVK